MFATYSVCIVCQKPVFLTERISPGAPSNVVSDAVDLKPLTQLIKGGAHGQKHQLKDVQFVFHSYCFKCLHCGKGLRTLRQGGYEMTLEHFDYRQEGGQDDDTAKAGFDVNCFCFHSPSTRCRLAQRHMRESFRLGSRLVAGQYYSNALCGGPRSLLPCPVLL